MFFLQSLMLKAKYFVLTLIYYFHHGKVVYSDENAEVNEEIT